MLWILCCLTQIIAYGVKASGCSSSSVKDIYVYGNDKLFIPDGAIFEFFVYDATTKANVYFCEECWSLLLSAYLYVYIYPNTNNYDWIIGPDYHDNLAWSSCYGGTINVYSLSSLSISSCLNVGNWRTYNGTEWNDDIDMSLSIREPMCYETAADIYPQTNSKTTQTVTYRVDTSTTWNGNVTDLYFDFSIYEEDCMNPQLSFSIQTYENIQIYDDNDTLIATCYGQSCGTFDPCLIDYYIDDIIQMNETYSIMIHQTGDINNLCGYIFEAVLTLTCIPTSTVGGKSPAQFNWGALAASIGIIIALIALYCIYKFICVSWCEHQADKFEQNNISMVVFTAAVHETNE